MDNPAAEKQSDNPLGLSDDDFMNNFHNHLEAAQVLHLPHVVPAEPGQRPAGNGH